MKKITLILLAFALVSCGDDSKIKAVIKQNLKDPESVQFRDLVTSQDGKRACIVWNAKNGMGGYGNWEISELVKSSSEWKIHKFEGSKENCSETGFRAIDAGVKAWDGAFLTAVDILHRVRKISSDEATELALSGKCSALVSEYQWASKKVAEHQVRQNLDWVNLYQKDLIAAQGGLENGTCQELKPCIREALNKSAAL